MTDTPREVHFEQIVEILSKNAEAIRSIDSKVDTLSRTSMHKDDLRTIQEQMATKDAVRGLDGKVDRVIETMVTQDEMRAFDDTLGHLVETVDRLAVSIDKIVARYDELYLEYAAIKIQLSRYERWFEQLAKQTGVTLEH